MMNKNSWINLIIFLLNTFCFIMGVVRHNWFNFYINGVCMIISFYMFTDELGVYNEFN